MTIRRKDFDERCYDLADDFLLDEKDMQPLQHDHSERVTKALAGDIQGVIEDFIESLRDEIRDAAKTENRDG